MAKKMRRVRTFARTASKSMEKSVVENAKKLIKDPYKFLPEYSDRISNIYFNKIKKSIDKVHRFKDDIKKLEKLSNKRGLDGAFAGTLIIANSEKAPYLGVAKFPTGDITYAQRGKADKEKLIAVQHFDDPVLRLLGIKDIATKKKLHIYSWDNGFISTGLEANPPKDFIDFVIKKNGLSNKNGVASCKHINVEKVKNKEYLDEPYLRINWKSADLIFAICESCTKSSKNTIFNISKYLIEPVISSDFIIDVIAQVVKYDKPGYEQKTSFVNEYLSGELSDEKFIKKNIMDYKETIKQSGEKILILDGVSYGIDVEHFVKKLKPNKYEKESLEFILKKIEEPVILNDVTPNKVLDIFWKKHGLEAIKSMIDNKSMAEKFYALDDSPSNILELVTNYRERQQILSQLPSYKSLPPLAKFADNIAKTYKTFGAEKTINEIKNRPDNPKANSLAYAFLLILGKGKDKKWQYSQIEIEYGEFLKDYAKKLLDSSPKNYNNALQELLTASGSSEKI